MNISIYQKRAYLIIFSLIILYYLKRIITVKENINKNNIKQLIPFILIAITPFIWYFIISNHSHMHYFFTYRNLIIFFFSGLCCLEFLCYKNITKSN